jgi:sugar fermentation stimulation protein A
MVKKGFRSVLIFCVQHSGAVSTGIAGDIDPLYTQTIRVALDEGVEVIAYKCDLSPERIRLEKKLPFSI